MRGTAGAGGVIAVNRVGVRIYLSVGPGGGKAADFTITSVTVARDTEGNPQLKAVVTNSGGRALDLTGELSLTAGPGGLSAGPFGLQQQTTLAPGEVRTADFSVPREIPNGPWNARVTLKSGLLERQAQTRITFPDDGPPTESVAKPAQEPAAPWWQILAALVLLAAALAWVLMRRSRRTRPAPDDPA
ncbi:hypothetical protein QFZ79_001440 [Arthrobacter sp. V4I6]|uniref:hypothetical protein n=1 Tax=unclassified Arthrobacter TaxID=235627 RepID=UPI0027849D00|nr:MULTISPECIES: hypothetical protein [unclassified Arthrobacter]MDQ0819147.1 hypothetical protein [Arthrobacter sp. V1I7]MDQ0853329.1 hypothetical protein [Arthrobacter sp. V4I6]